MTVGELRKLLAEHDEDAEVMVACKLGRDQVTFDLARLRRDEARSAVMLDAVIPRRWL